MGEEVAATFADKLHAIVAGEAVKMGGDPERCAAYLKARPAAGLFYPYINSGDRYLPRLLGGYVRMPDDPKDGFATAKEAREAAVRFKQACADWLQTQQTGPEREPEAGGVG